MAISLRVDPILEKELESAAKRQGITKSQFIIDAIQRSLGRKNSYDLMMKLISEEEGRMPESVKKAFEQAEVPYDTDGSRQVLLAKLRAKHGVSGAG